MSSPAETKQMEPEEQQTSHGSEHTGDQKQAQGAVPCPVRLPLSDRDLLEISEALEFRRKLLVQVIDSLTAAPKPDEELTNQLRGHSLRLGHTSQKFLSEYSDRRLRAREEAAAKARAATLPPPVEYRGVFVGGTIQRDFEEEIWKSAVDGILESYPSIDASGRRFGPTGEIRNIQRMIAQVSRSRRVSRHEQAGGGS